MWLLWEIVTNESQKRLGFNEQNQLNYLYKLYKLLYKPRSKYKFINIYIYALKYLTEMYDIKTPIIYNPYISIQLCLKINYIILQKKSNEVIKTSQVSLIVETPKKKINKSKKQLKEEKTNTQFDVLSNIDKNFII